MSEKTLFCLCVQYSKTASILKVIIFSGILKIVLLLVGFVTSCFNGNSNLDCKLYNHVPVKMQQCRCSHVPKTGKKARILTSFYISENAPFLFPVLIPLHITTGKKK